MSHLAGLERVKEGRADDAARRILHVDMDAFYASIEQRDNPALRGRPVAVGRGSGRGVVAAASYEARVFGVRSALPSHMALERCPELIFVPPRFDVYRAVSAQIHAIFRHYTALIQPLALDEAYLDVTEQWPPYGSATAVAEAIRRDIRQQTGLTASAGVSYNRFLAKLASGQRKPDGLFVISPRQGAAFVADLPVEKFHGVGPATTRRMHGLGIHTGADLRKWTVPELRQHFGSSAQFYHDIARGQDHRPVEVNRPRKSLGTETTFPHDVAEWDRLAATLKAIVSKLAAGCAQKRLAGRTVTLKLRYAGFHTVTRARSMAFPAADECVLLPVALEILRSFFPLDRPVRLLGLTISSLVSYEDRSLPVQMGLFEQTV
ncbi:DNA polymerase IV [Parasaccharibacter sp. TMW2.1890]|uniref:DNA polymerase IV n=1 Tax=Parasaccharibacter sp. TMW2.1890 TaxID=2039289 RepID=UPI0020137ED5|nr:DNA polymerase IV [Parasaccharibacter sp. TMW2.1890]MCL1514416.1 DNA polymerase IV [Parasaccharibacter sp. TMW2.1890]